MLYEIIVSLGLLKYGADDKLVKEVRSGGFTIEDGSIALDGVKDGAIIVIDGSDLNDGAYAYPTFTLVDEIFTGRVFVLRNKPDFMALVEEVEEWQTKNGTPSAYASESAPGYSYTRATTANGSTAGWKQAFAERLKPWKKV